MRMKLLLSLVFLPPIFALYFRRVGSEGGSKLHLHPYPDKVCLACGLKHGFRSAEGETIWYEGQTCDVCGETNVNVANPASFGHLRGAWGYKEKNTKEVTTLPTDVEVVSRRAGPPPVEEKPRQYRELG